MLYYLIRLFGWLWKTFAQNMLKNVSFFHAWEQALKKVFVWPSFFLYFREIRKKPSHSD